MRAIIYPRVSTVAQSDGESLSEQERECRLYCDQQGYTIVGVYQDTHSGYDTLSERPGMQQVRRLFRERAADCLVTWRFDRNSRDTTDLLVLHKELGRYGAHMESVTQGKVPNSALGKAMLALWGFGAEQERESFMARSKLLLRKRAEDGKLLGARSALFGYRYTVDKTGYELDAETAPIVRRIFEMALEGKGTREIARILYQDGVPTPTGWLERRGEAGDNVAGATWGRQTILRMLQNRSYTGEHVLYKRKRGRDDDGRKTLTVRPADDSVSTIAHPIPAIVSVEVFEQVQERLTGRMNGPSNTKDLEHAPLLSRGFAVCHYCQRPVQLKSGRKPSERFYQCGHHSGAADDLSRVCTVSWGANAAIIDEQVWAAVCESALDIPHVEQVLAGRRAQAQVKLDMANETRETVEQELADVEKHQATVRRRLGTEDDDTIAAQHRLTLTELNERHANLLKRRAALGRDEHKALRLVASFEQAHSLLVAALGKRGQPSLRVAVLGEWDTRRFFEMLTRAEKRSLMHGLGVKVELYRADDAYALEHGRRWQLHFGCDGEMDTNLTT